jgi:hypothetical protein
MYSVHDTVPPAFKKPVPDAIRLLPSLTAHQMSLLVDPVFLSFSEHRIESPGLATSLRAESREDPEKVAS